jgi:5-methylthioadenosine/S-adenosylhomocysteine deaminase
MKILIKGGILITMCPQRRVILDSFVRIEDGLITGVGKSSAAPSAKTFDEVYDASDQLIIPGLIDAHSHLFQALQGPRDGG